MINKKRQQLVKKIYTAGYYKWRDKLRREAIKTLENNVRDDARFDITVSSVLKRAVKIKAKILAKENGILAGLAEVSDLYKKNGLKVRPIKKDGDKLKKGDIIAEVIADNQDLLKLERVGLNFLQRMSGIATYTKKISDKVKPYGMAVLGTRKTLFNFLDKKAVLLGGGLPHRMGLFDSILIKDNHLDYIRLEGEKEPIKVALTRAYKKQNLKRTDFIEIEVPSMPKAIEAASFYVKIVKDMPIPEQKISRKVYLVIMLDNMTPGEIKKTVTKFKKRRLYNKVILEASGMINEKNIIAYARSGVDAASLGALTHSVKALDISQKII